MEKYSQVYLRGEGGRFHLHYALSFLLPPFVLHIDAALRFIPFSYPFFLPLLLSSAPRRFPLSLSIYLSICLFCLFISSGVRSTVSSSCGNAAIRQMFGSGECIEANVLVIENATRIKELGIPAF